MPKGSAGKEDNTGFEIKFYENILKDRPDFIEALKALAELYTKSGRHNEGLELDKRLAKLLPGDATVYYNLACSYSLLQDIERSLDAIKKAVELGYDDFSYMHKDPDLENLRKDGRFTEIVVKKLK